MDAKRLNKVLKLDIVKPLGAMTWPELGAMLRTVRYRVFRLANIAITEKYQNWRAGTGQPTTKMSCLNQTLADMLVEEDKTGKRATKRDKAEKPAAEWNKRLSEVGAVRATVWGALEQYKIRALTQKTPWLNVLRGKAALPTFRLNIPIPIRCDNLKSHRRMEREQNGDVTLELMICKQPYPKVLLASRRIGDGAEAILDRLLDNPEQSPDGYRQRSFEIKHDERRNKWVLLVSYDFPAPKPHGDKSVIVGVDVGFSCPLYAALNNGHARLGWKRFAPIATRIRALKGRVMKKRSEVQAGGRLEVSSYTARTGHGRDRKLAPTEKWNQVVNNFYTTMNHQMSATVVKFARDHGAGVVQMENLEGLKGKLSGTYLGRIWRYYQLQTFIKYKCAEAGIEFRKVDARYTSRRCSNCGYINMEFTREHRDKLKRSGKPAKFECPQCGVVYDADYNAARNLAVDGITDIIKKQCKQQKIDYGKAEDEEEEVEAPAL